MDKRLWLTISMVCIVALAACLLLSTAKNVDGDSGVIIETESETPSVHSLSAPSRPWSPPAPVDAQTTLPSPSNRVWGLVTDGNGQAVAGVVVTLLDNNRGLSAPLSATQTDLGGRYVFTDPPIGDQAEVTVLVAGDTFGGGVNGAQLESGESDLRLDIELVRGDETMAGTVCLPTGEPAAFADLLVIGFDSTARRMLMGFAFGNPDSCAGVGRGVTDAQGRFEVHGLPSGSLTVMVRPDGQMWDVAAQSVDLPSGPIEILLEPDVGVVAGQVTRALSGEPLPGATVSIGDEINGLMARTVTADTEGHFRFENLPLMNWRVQIAPPDEGFAIALLSAGCQEQGVQLAVGEMLDLSGVFIDVDSGAPVPNLGFSVHNRSWGESVAAGTDDQGLFETSVPVVRVGTGVSFGDIGPHWCFNTGYASRTESIDLSADAMRNLRVMVCRARPLEILTLDPNGEPLTGVALRLASESSPTPLGIGETDGEGRLIAARPWWVRDCQVIGSCPDWPILQSPIVTHADSDTVVRPAPVTDLEILVLNPDGVPAPGAVVEIAGQIASMGSVDPRGRHGRAGRTEANATTDETGRVVFEGRPRTLHFLHATLAGEPASGQSGTGPSLFAEAQDQIDLTNVEEESARATLRLQVVGDLIVTGRVLDPQGTPIPNAELRWKSQPNDQGFFLGEDDSTYRTDAPPDAVADVDGRFTLTGTRNQSWRGFSVSFPGYMTQSSPRNVTRQSDHKFRLSPEVTLRGQITPQPSDIALNLFQPAPGSGLSGWTVAAQCTAQPADDGLIEWTLPALGQFPMEFTYPSPAWIMASTRDGHVATAGFMIGTEPAQVIDLGTLAFQPALHLDGRVLSAQREPVTGALVSWTGDSPPFEETFAWTANTDDQGLFTLTGLPPGLARVSVSVDPTHRQVFEVELPTDEPVELVLDPIEATTLRLRLIGLAGIPIPLAETSVWLPGGHAPEDHRHTDAAGETLHTGLAPGRCYFKVSLQSQGCGVLLYMWTEIESGGHTEVIDLSTWPLLRGQVTRDGIPAPGVAMIFTGGGLGLNPNTVTTTTDANGRFAVPLMPDRWEVWTGFVHPNAVVEVPTDEPLIIDLLHP